MSVEPAIQFSDVSYELDSGKTLLANLTLEIKQGEVLILLGRSGSGKTTTLKLVNRLLVPTSGQVVIEGKNAAQWDVIRLRRHIGYAIQDVGLFPHYTVQKNVSLVPELENWELPKIKARVNEVLNLVGLDPKQFADRYPKQLSGGQRQRVGLARALAADPPILLMDEPFGALDPITRAEIQKEFQSLQKRLGKTVVFVTHDVGEALLVGERIAFMEAGKLQGLYSRNDFLRASDPMVQPYLEALKSTSQFVSN